MKKSNLIGQTFNDLTVIEFAPSKSGNAHWRCLCTCGKETIVSGCNLKSGHTASCGHRAVDTLLARITTHGKTHSREYSIWAGMKDRCNNPESEAFAHYGGRGIRLCAEWNHSFEAFLRDMGECPPNRSIDRIDNNSGYSKDNCRWATAITQMRNTRRNVKHSFQGQSLCVSEWAERLNLSAFTIYARLRRGWTIEQALTAPVEKLESQGRCVEPGCDKQARTRQLCKHHYEYRKYRKTLQPR